MLRKLITLAFCVAGLTLSTGLEASQAFKKSAGILVVGTQAEVKAILKDTGLKLKFSEENPTAKVAVALTNRGMKVYERGAVEDIIKFIGGVVEGGVVLTLKVGSALWELLQDLAGVTVQVGNAVLKAAAWVLTHTTAVVMCGVTFAVQTAGEILAFVGDVLAWIFGH